MTSITQVAQNHYRVIDSNALDVSGNIGVVSEYVPYTDVNVNSFKSGRRVVILNLDSINSIEVDASSTVTPKTATSLSDALSKINAE